MTLRFKRCVVACHLPVTPSHILPSDANIYDYMPCAFKRIRIYISCVAIFLAKKFVALSRGYSYIP